VVRFVTVHGGVAYSQKTSAKLAERAEEELSAIPDIVIRESLQSAVRYAVTRER
jgi:geranylgeranyl pyrophosphate synthase